MILLDTDVLIDIALDRMPHSDAAFELLDRIERGVEPASIAWHSISNLYYIVKTNPRRHHNPRLHSRADRIRAGR